MMLAYTAVLVKHWIVHTSGYVISEHTYALYTTIDIEDIKTYNHVNNIFLGLD